MPRFSRSCLESNLLASMASAAISECFCAKQECRLHRRGKEENSAGEEKDGVGGENHAAAEKKRKLFKKQKSLYVLVLKKSLMRCDHWKLKRRKRVTR